MEGISHKLNYMLNLELPPVYRQGSTESIMSNLFKWAKKLCDFFFLTVKIRQTSVKISVHCTVLLFPSESLHGLTSKIQGPECQDNSQIV